MSFSLAFRWYLNVVLLFTESTVPHELFTPLLIGFVAAAVILLLILIVLSYKYMQVNSISIHRMSSHCDINETNHNLTRMFIDLPPIIPKKESVSYYCSLFCYANNLFLVVYPSHLATFPPFRVTLRQ